MPRLSPYPFAGLVSRMFREHERTRSIFDLPARRFFLGTAGPDCSVWCHRQPAATPYGPAAGPHTQLAQNLVLSWLGGARILELKTVQVRDDLRIPRPCIDMRTVGYNVEWSQELPLDDSLAEYVKASMLIRMLSASGIPALAHGLDRTVYDISVGYDLAGIRSGRVERFIRGMLHAAPVVDRLRAEIPVEYRRLAALDFDTRISTTITLSTFHGCPPAEVEAIVEHLLSTFDVDVVVKLNPMLLGAADTRRLLHEVLGYHDILLPATAFDRELTWDQMTALVDRLDRLAVSRGRRFGVKFANTLVVRNPGRFLPPSEPVAYLSGPPLHVLAVELVRRFRGAFGDRIPVSFSGGVDRGNFAETVALGLVPVTVCSDLLKPGGYGRARGYLDRLCERMRESGATTIDEHVIRAHGQGPAALAAVCDEPARQALCRRALEERTSLLAASGDALFRRWVSAARLRNTEAYAARVIDDPRYRAAAHRRSPRTIAQPLERFDCVTCDKCIPVCPNDAVFVLPIPAQEVPVAVLVQKPTGWVREERSTLRLVERHQIGTMAELCNDCGNCDVFCPEEGSPAAVKPRFFLTEASWRAAAPCDGLYLAPGGAQKMRARVFGRELLLERQPPLVRFAGEGFDVTFREDDLLGTVSGTAAGEIDLTCYYLMTAIRRAVLFGPLVNFVNAWPAADEHEAGHGRDRARGGGAP